MKGKALLASISRTAMFALAMGAVAIAAPGGSATADPYETYRTSCRSNDCVRFLCDEMGRNCFLLGYFDRREEAHQARDEYQNMPNSSYAPPHDGDRYNYGNNAPHYHYTNHFDPDNDYDDYMN